MSVFRLPSPMPESGRLPMGKRAYDGGKTAVTDPLGSCEQTIHINLFFDGTNNNDAPQNPWRDSKSHTHTNVARLFNATSDLVNKGIYKYYIVGVGTPFPEIDEHTYSSAGKALAVGFAKRCAWGYTRVLNALHEALTGRHDDHLIPDDVANTICSSLDGDLHSFKLSEREKHLGSIHDAVVRSCQSNRLIKKAHINVFGFSRGAAGARVFVSKLIKSWATGGKLIGKIPYEVNFMGLFDTVASVGPPDSTRAAVDFEDFDGHFGWAKGGALDIPEQVRRCVHFFAMHEQRMSFPLDSIRKDKSYPADDYRRREVAYPGVHSDVGGSYAPGDQGKSIKGEGHRLGKITLHDMYIEALKSGVPLYTVDARNEEDRMNDLVQADFSIDPAVAKAFNDWLAKLPALDSLEKAFEYGMRQSLQWRTLRAGWHNRGKYITNQSFYGYCADPANKREDSKTPHQLQSETDEAMKTDPSVQRLQAENERLHGEIKRIQDRNMFVRPAPQVMADMATKKALEAKIATNDAAIAARGKEIMAQKVGKKPSDCRPGEGTSLHTTPSGWCSAESRLRSMT
ncbi:MAG: T6SS phospholipase effector Tle1-like catalytic domain-containing protein [Cupriavidus necator]